LGLDRAANEFQLFYIEGNERDIEELERKIEEKRNSK
jgi:hypothetical protein